MSPHVYLGKVRLPKQTKKEIEEKILNDILILISTSLDNWNKIRPLLQKAISLTFEEAEKENAKNNLHLINLGLIKQVGDLKQQLSAYKQKITEIVEEWKKKAINNGCCESDVEELLSKINNQSQQTKHTNIDEPTPERNILGKPVALEMNDKTADTEPEKLEDGTNKPSPRVEIPRSGSLNSKDLDFNSYVEGLVDGARAQKDGVLYIEKENEVCKKTDKGEGK